MPHSRKPTYEEKKAHNLWTRYRITVEEHKLVTEANGGVCECCGKRKGRVIDHCHDTGDIRGYLCISCNNGLGLLGDTEESLEQAIEYLRRERSHGIPTRRRVSGATRQETLQEDDRGRSKSDVCGNVRVPNRTRNKRNRQNAHGRKTKQ